MGGRRLRFQVSDGRRMVSQLSVRQCNRYEGRKPNPVDQIRRSGLRIAEPAEDIRSRSVIL